MYVAKALVSFGIRQVIGVAVDHVVDAVFERFADPTQILPRALGRAHDRSWQALGLALAGDGLIDRVRVLLASGEERAVRSQVSRFLAGAGAGIGTAPSALRAACLADLRRLNAPGRAVWPEPKELAAATARSPRLTDLTGLIGAAHRTVELVADDLGPEYPHLTRLLRQPAPSGPPLLVGAFLFFLRREVEKNPELARALTFDALGRIADHQAAGFAEISAVLDQVGDRLDELLDGISRVEGVTVATHGAVLDVRAELDRVGKFQEAHADEVCTLLRETVNRLARLELDIGATQSGETDSEFGPTLEVFEQPAPPKGAPAPVSWAAGELLTNTIGMRFAWAPPGEFFMERPTDELEPEWNENPSAVRIRQGFFIGVHPVTQAQWQALMGTNPARFRGSDHPVEMISWDDAVTFCRRLSERGTGTYRLPTEVEWEYACRAGDCGRLTHPRAGFSVGSLSPRATATEFGHVRGNREAQSGVRPRLSEKVGHPTVGDSGGTQPVGQRGPNPWGLFDTGGNVWEWCADASGPAGAHLRVLRGGSWFDPPERCGVAARLAYDRAAATSAFGLRVVLEG